MKQHSYILLLIIGLFTSACFEDSDINTFIETDRNLVIEGVITDSDTIHTVRLSYLQHPDSTQMEFVSEALVTLQIDQGEAIPLHETNPGEYTTTSLTPSEGQSVQLEVSTDNNTYNASEHMLPALHIDSTNIVYFENEPYYSDGFYIIIYSNIPTSQVRFFKLELSKNDSLYNNYQDLIVYESSFTTEKQSHVVPYPFEPSDTVDLQFYSLSEPVYEYFYALSQLTTNVFYGMHSPSQNPPGNITNDALGYFQVSALTTMQIIIQ